MSALTFNTKDGKSFTVDSRIANLSRNIQNWFESSSDAMTVDLDSAIFAQVVQYCELHDYKPPKIQKPLKSQNLKDNLSDKDYKFVQAYDYLTIKPLLDAAFYLIMDSLREVCITVIASEFFIGNTIDDIEKLKSKFGVNTDLTLNEEQELLKEYPWAEDDVNEDVVEQSGMYEEESKA
jgi:Skp1 family, tetramerisation domain